ncbi:MFS-type transporter SLC18B1-like [Planococcus citri]|uniref:MFS-type transporter SLC18B1-like n=1 Tax=Planococcus citri TaxID=170843 RepID=UPI0031F837B9
MQFSQFTRRQILTLAAFGAADFCNAICVSLQAPFFPDEAERKGASATEYGFVFGVFELVVFLVSPWYGKHVKNIGPKRMFFSGICISGVCSILFGLLDFIDEHIWFISFAFLIRIIEAMGNAAFLTASFAIIANEFPENIATTFASLETFFGLGLIAGPSLGGVLYELGGYTTPFVSLGALLFITAILTKVVLPSHEEIQTTTKTTGKLLQILHVEGIPVCAATILSTSTTISFFQATLEPHIRQYDLTRVVVGLVFIVTGATYGSSAPWWGWLCDKYLKPKTVAVIGGLILIVGVSLVGPAPFMPFQGSLLLVIVGLFLHGLGIGARLVSSFADALQTAISSGLPNDIETYGMVSGLWTSSFALGAFIGPTVSGVLYDQYTFANASLFLIILVFVMVIIELLSLSNIPRKQQLTTSSSIEAFLSEKLNRSNQNLSISKDGSTFKDNLPNIYQNNVGIGSSRVLNLLYSSDTDLTEENAPLLVESRA